MEKIQSKAKARTGTLRHALVSHKWLYLMIIPGVLYMLIFNYLPMGGLVMAFQDFSPYNGDTMLGAFTHSPFVGMDIFRKFFTGPDFFRLLKNTLSISLASLVFYFPAPIILALLFNEIRSVLFKRVSQTMVYIPHFISMVIVAALTAQLFSTTDGLVYHVFELIFGRKNAPDIMSDPNLFVTMLIGQSMWKETGYGTIIFLAALSGVDVQLYEAAEVDGAGRWRRMWHITLPAIRSTIVIMLILRVGAILNTGYEQIFLMQNSMNRIVSDVFDTYIYTKGVVNGDYSLATAAGMFKSVVSMIMVMGANRLAKVFGESGFY
ncbi:ABC transporter permease subunit [Clostridium sp. KNHs205]|uniref:ABC transporter permease n=1 Tax=Clostridium sp. KNHs205 TaxID=1449050 RepID=UPI00051BE028|nr:ABC transporter permease subunit [Clostridium sp. KNHs205]